MVDYNTVYLHHPRGELRRYKPHKSNDTRCYLYVLHNTGGVWKRVLNCRISKVEETIASGNTVDTGVTVRSFARRVKKHNELVGLSIGVLGRMRGYTCVKDTQDKWQLCYRIATPDPYTYIFSIKDGVNIRNPDMKIVPISSLPALQVGKTYVHADRSSPKFIKITTKRNTKDGVRYYGKFLVGRYWNDYYTTNTMAFTSHGMSVYREGVDISTWNEYFLNLIPADETEVRIKCKEFISRHLYNNICDLEEVMPIVERYKQAKPIRHYKTNRSLSGRLRFRLSERLGNKLYDTVLSPIEDCIKSLDYLKAIRNYASDLQWEDIDEAIEKIEVIKQSGIVDTVKTLTDVLDVPLFLYRAFTKPLPSGVLQSCKIVLGDRVFTNIVRDSLGTTESSDTNNRYAMYPNLRAKSVSRSAGLIDKILSAKVNLI